MVRLAEQRDRVFGTRASRTHYEAVRAELPEAQYHEPAQMVWVDRRPETPGRRGVALVGAGTSDLPVAEEARLALELMGEEPVCLQDVGVAGLHRVVSHLETLQRSNVVIVVAGMEGALPSLVGGLIEAPVIAVPTSVGYGASFGGMAALLSMLNSCAPGVAVVNIDHGFGAGHRAAPINRRIAEGDRERED
jgi:NCAIR mutase (PurE)-related protein